MKTPFLIYTIVWVVMCLLAVFLMFRNKSKIELFQRRYWQMLFQPWKIGVFVIATVGMTIIAPYTGDPTWDYFDTPFMSTMTVATAPWVVATFYRFMIGIRNWTYLFVATCFWMFSASWSYDLYLYLRDGYYPMTWLPNIFASSVLYVLAGMLWSLEWHKGRGVVFGFMLPNWPEQVVASRPGKVLGYASLIIAFVTALMIPFFI